MTLAPTGSEPRVLRADAWRVAAVGQRRASAPCSDMRGWLPRIGLPAPSPQVAVPGRMSATPFGSTGAPRSRGRAGSGLPVRRRARPWRPVLAAAMLACLFALLAACRSVQPAAPPLRVMTLNVRLPLLSDGPHRWQFRRDAMAALIRDAAPDVLATQELMLAQGDDLAARLPGYAWFGVGRRGGSQDEHMGVFYRRDTLRLLDSGHYWLSETPQVPGSISWGHPYPRMVSWGLFERRADGLRFHLSNTHLPYRPQDGDARLRAAALILERLGPAAGPPVLVLGDFNDAPGSAVHRRLTAVLDDAWERTPRRDGPSGTFHGFSGTPGDRIDWVLSRGLRVRSARTLDQPVEGRPVSDHFPVLVEFDPMPGAR